MALTGKAHVALAVAIGSGLTQCGCATSATIVPGAPLEVRSQPLPPFAMHEECASLAPGDRLRYRFESTAPLSFNVHYRDGKVMVIPVTRERTTGDAGTFAPLDAHDYCLAWEAGVEGASIDYSIELLRGASK